MIHFPDARFLTAHPFQIRSIQTYGDFVDLFVLFFLVPGNDIAFPRSARQWQHRPCIAISRQRTRVARWSVETRPRDHYAAIIEGDFGSGGNTYHRPSSWRKKTSATGSLSDATSTRTNLRFLSGEWLKCVTRTLTDAPIHRSMIARKDLSQAPISDSHSSLRHTSSAASRDEHRTCSISRRRSRPYPKLNQDQRDIVRIRFKVWKRPDPGSS